MMNFYINGIFGKIPMFEISSFIEKFLENHEESNSSISLMGHVTELWQVIIITIAVYLSSGKNYHFYLSMDIFPLLSIWIFHTFAHIFTLILTWLRILSSPSTYRVSPDTWPVCRSICWKAKKYSFVEPFQRLDDFLRRTPQLRRILTPANKKNKLENWTFLTKKIFG